MYFQAFSFIQCFRSMKGKSMKKTMVRLYSQYASRLPGFWISSKSKSQYEENFQENILRLAKLKLTGRRDGCLTTCFRRSQVETNLHPLFVTDGSNLVLPCMTCAFIRFNLFI